MKNKFITLALLSIISVSCNSETNQKKMNAEQEYKNQTLETIHSRKSVREYTSQAVDKETLIELVKAGMAAPTGRNIRPWEFVILYENDLMDTLANNLPYAKMLAGAAAAIVVCGNPDTEKAGSSLWVMDCSAATQNILLAAESLGLGAVWTAGYPYEDRMNIISKTLSLPSHIIPLCVIPIGYPEGKQTPKKKFDPTKIKFNTYNSTETVRSK